MALVTTPGAANADSYTSVEEADQYHSDRANSAWTGTQAEKEGALRRATDWIDATFHDRWPGSPLNGRGQSLDWPRTSATDHYGDEVDSAEIPPELKAATAEGALLEIISPRSLIGATDAVEGGTIIKEVVGPIEVSYSQPISATSGTVAAIENHLIPLIGPSLLLPAILVV